MKEKLTFEEVIKKLHYSFQKRNKLYSENSAIKKQLEFINNEQKIIDKIIFDLQTTLKNLTVEAKEI